MNRKFIILCTFFIAIASAGVWAQERNGEKENGNNRETQSLSSRGGGIKKTEQEDYDQLLMRSYEFLEKKNYAEAKKLYDKANVLREKKYKEQIDLASKAFLKKNYAEAKENYSQALAIKPNDSYSQKRMEESQKMLDDLSKGLKVGSPQEKTASTGEVKIQPLLVSNVESGEPVTDKIFTTTGALPPKAEEVKSTDKKDSQGTKITGVKQKKTNDIEGSKTDTLPASFKINASKFPEETAGNASTIASNTAKRKNKKDEFAEDEAEAVYSPRERSINERYDSAIARATAVFEKKDYEAAIEYYRQASLLKPKETFPGKMIKYVQSVIFYAPKVQQRDNELKRKAEIVELKDKANEAIFNKNWDSAKIYFSQILSLNPIKADEEFAKKKIETINLELARRGNEAPAKQETVAVVSAPKTKRELRTEKKLAERSRLLASASTVAKAQSASSPSSITKVPDTKIAAPKVNEEENVNYNTLNQFYADFKNAEDVTWTVKPNFVKADFTQDGEKMEAFYDLNDALIGRSRHLSLNELPLFAKRTFAKQYAGYTVVEVVYFQGVDEVAYYISAEDGEQKVILRVANADEKRLDVFEPDVAAEQKAPVKPKVQLKEKMGQAVEAMAKKNWANARALYEEALALNPSKADEELIRKKIELIDLELQIIALKEAKTQKTASESSATLTKNTGSNEAIIRKLPQENAIPYSSQELAEKYPGINFNTLPEGQTGDPAGKENKAQYYTLSKKVLAEQGHLNLSDSNNQVKLICQGINFNGSDAFFKLLVQNGNNVSDFVTGPVQLTLIKNNGALKQYNTRYISNFPIVMPGREFPLVYVAEALTDIAADDVFIIEMNDRQKKTILTVSVPGHIYNEQKGEAL